MELKIKDRVKLPFNETGTIDKILNLPLGYNYIVRIRKATLNKTNEKIEFKKEQLILENDGQK